MIDKRMNISIFTSTNIYGMTLQQLKYIVEINRYRSFAQAAESLEITQPTLSAMLQKLESELDVRIFDRTNKSVTPTAIGELIISQAEQICSETARLTELIDENKNKITGTLNMSIGPTIAPYILPGFIRDYRACHPQVALKIEELKAESMFEGISRGQIDVGIALSEYQRTGILEIPLYTEPFWVYISDECLRKLPVFKPENLEHEKMWVMREAQCLRKSTFSFCRTRETGYHIYEAGSIETLIRVVDANGGFTIIPEMHLPFLSDKQRENVRPLEGSNKSMRKISMYIKDDFVRQSILNSIISTIVSVVPKKMVEQNILTNGVKL